MLSPVWTRSSSQPRPTRPSGSRGPQARWVARPPDDDRVVNPDPDAPGRLPFAGGPEAEQPVDHPAVDVDGVLP
jgi:hypothetical protein